MTDSDLKSLLGSCLVEVTILSTSDVLSSSKYTCGFLHGWESVVSLEDVCASPSLGGTIFPCSLCDLDRTAPSFRVSLLLVHGFVPFSGGPFIICNAGESTAASAHFTHNVQNGESNYWCCVKMQVKGWESCLLHWSYIKGLFYPLCFNLVRFPFEKGISRVSGTVQVHAISLSGWKIFPHGTAAFEA